MVIIGSPKNLEGYYMADEEIAFVLHQKGFVPVYKDADAIYFRLNKKLKKVLTNLGIQIEEVS